jgi:hypothetical protein
VAAETVARVTVGQCSPALASLVTSAIAELSGKLAGFLNIQAALTISPPSLSAQLDGALGAVATIQAQISAGLTVSPPGVNLSIAAVAGAVAELNAQLAILIALQEAMSTAGVTVIVENGEAQNFGREMQVEVSRVAPAGNAVQAITFLATEPAVFAALGAVLFTG